jgi:hypothetical protein
MNFGVSGIIEKNVYLLAASTKNYALCRFFVNR